MHPLAKIKVLHTIECYLSNTENWIFRLLSNIPGSDATIASKTFLPCPFYSPDFRFLRFPFSVTKPKKTTFRSRVNNMIAQRALRIYPWWVSSRVGEVDLIHSHFAPCGWTYRNTARRLGIPHVVSFYGYDYESLPYRDPVWIKRYRDLFKLADAFICEGKHGSETLQKIGCPKEKIHIVRLGLAPDSIPFVRRVKQQFTLRLVQIASLVAKKGHADTIDAFSRALVTCPNMTLTIVGSEPDSNNGIISRKIDSLITDLNRTHIHRVKSIDYSNLHAYMAHFDVFIHPSRYSEQRDCEGGAPVVLLDAQATGLPVISTTHCDIPEEVVDGKTGILCPENDLDQLTEAIKRFYYMGSEEYTYFSVNARKHVSNNYDISNNAVDLRNIYDRLIHCI